MSPILIRTMEDNQEKESQPLQTKQKGPSRAKLIYTIASAGIIVVIAVVILLMFGSNSSSKIVAVGDNISVYFTGSFTNGTVFDTNVGTGRPLSFIVGSGTMIPGFDQAVIGMRVGQTKNVTLPPSEAFGYVNSSRIITVNASLFRNNSITDGELIPNGYGGYAFISAINGSKMSGVFKPSLIINGTKRWGNDTNVTINFNSPFAGYTVNFEIEVASINSVH